MIGAMDYDPIARAAASGMMPDRCRIVSPRGETEGTINPTTYEVTPSPEVEFWSGPCLVQPAASNLEARAAGGGFERVTESRIKVPAHAEGAATGRVVEITTGPLTGTRYTILAVLGRSRRHTLTLRVRDTAPVPAPGIPA